MNRPPVVSTLSIAFKKAITPSEDLVETKKAHRATLRELMDDYMAKVRDNKIDGIRNAKDLVEVMKMDLLLLSESNPDDKLTI